MSAASETGEPAEAGKAPRPLLRRLLSTMGLAALISLPGGDHLVAPIAPARALASGLPHAVQPRDGEGRHRHLHLAPLVDGGRLTSEFGYRKHPMGGGGVRHEGIDIAAPTGAAVRAAAGGRIINLGWLGRYGRYIRIRHADGLETAYAHLSGFARGLKVGERVKQEQIIGRVGSSGSSTAPHLHFEVHRNGKPVNPLALPHVRSRR